VLNDPSYIKEALGMTSFSGRPDFKSFHLMSEGRNGKYQLKQ